MGNSIEDAEMSIISLMESADTESVLVSGTHRFGGKKIDRIDAGNALLKFSNMKPSSAFAFDMRDTERLYTYDYRMLVSSFPDLIGDQAEVFVKEVDSDCVKWIGLRACKKAPKGVCSLPSAKFFYEYHFRSIFPNGVSEYSKRCVAFGSDGRPMPVWGRGSQLGSEREMYSSILIASIIEDATRADCATATIHEDVSLTFPLGLDAYKDFFSLRDAPKTKNGRRKAIAHWVAKHKRKVRDSETSVKKHKRGVSELDIGGLKVSLTLN
jgi:hypothetical protein